MNKKTFLSIITLSFITVIIVITLFIISKNKKIDLNESTKSVLNTDLSFETNNDTVKVYLEGNITTGYSWSYELSNDLLVLLEENYVPVDTSNTRIGSGGTFIFTFKTSNAGDTKIDFKYSRPWDENSTIKEYSLDFSIDDDLNIQVK